MKKILTALLLSFCLVFCTSCNMLSGDLETTGNENLSFDENITYGSDSMFSDKDSDSSDIGKEISITLSGDSVSAPENTVTISDGIITLKEEATYVFSGTLNDGTIYVNAPDTAKINIILNNADITSKDFVPLYILSCDKVFVTLKEGTENSLSSGESLVMPDENRVDGSVFSKQNITFNGSGSLNISSPLCHAVVCKDDLVFTGGTYSLASASHGIDANDSIRIKDSSFTVYSGMDGMHCENTEDSTKGFIYIENGSFDITSEGDGISAGSTLEILDGTFNITAGGGSKNAVQKTSEDWGSFPGGGMNPHGDGGRTPPGGGGMTPPMGRSTDTGSTYVSYATPLTSTADSTGEDASDSIKGLKSTGNMIIHKGTFTLNTADDAIHSNSSVTVNGGSFTVSTGDDGIHGDNSLTVNGGTINITESYEGLEALTLHILAGNITLVADDDGINAAGGTDMSGRGGFRDDDRFAGGSMSQGSGSIVISGGNIDITASGDGIDANGSIEITGGYISVQGPTQGDTATLDYDTTATISGGTFIGTGASGMAQTFSESPQGIIAVRVASGSADTAITITDSEGKLLLSHTPSLSYDVIIFSSPDITKGTAYTLKAGTLESTVTAS